MSFQIKDIVLYGPRDELRVLSLRPGEVNIITGASKTGKSSLISIVDYCCGGSHCEIPEGPIRQSVEWVGMRLCTASSEAFVARKAPVRGKDASSEIYLCVANHVEIPKRADLVANLNTEALEAYLTRLSGIDDNVNEPPPGQTRSPLAANIRHGLFFCFQPQEEILSKKTLFYRQGEPFIVQAIKDVLPYFLGAIDEDQVAKQNYLRNLRHELRNVERQLKEFEALRGDGLSKALLLLLEAKDCGFPIDVPKGMTSKEAVDLLTILQRERPAVNDGDVIEDGNEYRRLLDERDDLRQEYQMVRNDIEWIGALKKAGHGFSTEADAQIGRLKTLHLFGGDQDVSTCPLCNSQLPESTEPITLAKDLCELSASLDRVQIEVPQLENAAATRENTATKLRRRLLDNRAALTDLQQQRDRVQEMRDSLARQAHIMGRISLYLESIPEISNEPNDLSVKATELKQKIASLESDVGQEANDERLLSILSRLSKVLSAWAEELDLEHSEFPIRLDLKKLQIVADARDGAIPMHRMGSGSNFVGYHLIVHLALHSLFVENNRPVPRFLFVDQPSEVFFPAENDANRNSAILKDEDREALNLMFNLIWKAVAALHGGFQVIITEHADLNVPWFKEAVVERWRGGNALIPTDWLTSISSSLEAADIQ